MAYLIELETNDSHKNLGLLIVSAAHFENGTAFEAHFVHMTFAECFVARVQQQNGCQQGFKNSKHIK